MKTKLKSYYMLNAVKVSEFMVLASDTLKKSALSACTLFLLAAFTVLWVPEYMSAEPCSGVQSFRLSFNKL